MTAQKPNLLKMTRAPFLSSILSPLLFGSFIAAALSNEFHAINFILVILLGIFLHIATNVYNDIYDTLQGTDKINVHRNEFSGGSGVLVDDPDQMPIMFRLARWSLVFALVISVILFVRIDVALRPHLFLLYLFSAFFAKYYTAAPVKLAYRGLGEFFVWFAFGPMAVLVAAVSQNIGLHPVILIAMPITGISTLSILLIGQMIDHDADKATGKWGIAVRGGNKAAARLYAVVQVFLLLNVLALAFYMSNGWPLLLAAVPYLLLMPRLVADLLKNAENIETVKQLAGRNVQLHLLLLVTLFIGSLIVFFIR